MLNKITDTITAPCSAMNVPVRIAMHNFHHGIGLRKGSGGLLEVQPLESWNGHRRWQAQGSSSDWEQGFPRVQPRCKALQGPSSQWPQNRVSEELLCVQCKVKCIIACVICSHSHVQKQVQCKKSLHPCFHADATGSSHCCLSSSYHAAHDASLHKAARMIWRR